MHASLSMRHCRVSFKKIPPPSPDDKRTAQTTRISRLSINDFEFLGDILEWEKRRVNCLLCFFIQFNVTAKKCQLQAQNLNFAL